MARPRKPRPEPMPQSDSYPLTDEHCELICSVEDNAAICDAIIQRCKRAGYNVDDYADVVQQQRTLAEGLKREFFPSRI